MCDWCSVVGRLPQEYRITNLRRARVMGYICKLALLTLNVYSIHSFNVFLVLKVGQRLNRAYVHCKLPCRLYVKEQDKSSDNEQQPHFGDRK